MNYKHNIHNKNQTSTLKLTLSRTNTFNTARGLVELNGVHYKAVKMAASATVVRDSTISVTEESDVTEMAL